MTELLEIAFQKISSLPEAEQDRIAAYILEMAPNEEELEEIPPEHLAAVLEGLAQADRGEFVPEEEMREFFARYLK
jgi:predicted transcriptional regulator